MSTLIPRIPREQRETADRERLVGYIAAIYRLHLGIASTQVSEMMRLDDRAAGADMYSQAQELCRRLEKKFGFAA